VRRDRPRVSVAGGGANHVADAAHSTGATGAVTTRIHQLSGCVSLGQFQYATCFTVAANLQPRF